jgi:hypothetical protein
MHATCPMHLILDLLTSDNIGWKVQIMMLFIM